MYLMYSSAMRHGPRIINNHRHDEQIGPGSTYPTTKTRFNKIPLVASTNVMIPRLKYTSTNKDQFLFRAAGSFRYSVCSQAACPTPL